MDATDSLIKLRLWTAVIATSLRAIHKKLESQFSLEEVYYLQTKPKS
jgi:hypothetical protein